MSEESRIPTPEEWVRCFRSTYKKELDRDGGYLDQAFRRAKTRRKLSSEKRYFLSGESPEWTALVSILLAQAARRLGFRQEWEWAAGRKKRRRIDLVWRPRTRDTPISVLIEHESQWGNERATRRLWVRSPMIDTLALRVLITYTETQGPTHRTRDWPTVREEVLSGIGS